MKYPEEYMKLLSVFTGDSSYEKIIPDIPVRKQKGEVITMCTVAQGLMERGRIEGRNEGRTEQFEKDIRSSINMLRELNIDDDKIKELIIRNYELTKQEAEAILSKNVK